MSETSKIDNFISKLKTGEVGTSKKSSKPSKMLKEGPIKFSRPEKQEVKKLIDYDKVVTKVMKPNKIKLGIKHGENRFPPEARVPNHKKYDSKGNYIKHKPKTTKTKTIPDESIGAAVRSSILSNPYRRGRMKP